MKKNISKLALRTDKIASLSASKMSALVGGNKKQIASGPFQTCETCNYC